MTITIRARTGTRTFEAGVQVVNGGPDLAYRPAIDRVLLTLGGTLEALDAVDPAAIAALLDVAGLGPGTTAVPVTARLPAGVSLVAASPPEVTVTVTPVATPRPDRLAGDTPRGDPVAASHAGAVTMGRLFGTDGIRGVANVDLRPPLAYALGQGGRPRAGRAGRGPGRGPGHAALGRDARARRSPPARRAWARTSGSPGSCPTPALAFLAGSGAFAAGIMVSASHNPADDNGLKVLDSRGLKLDESAEDALEQLIWRTEELGGPRNAGIGRVVDAPDLVDRYRADRRRLAPATRATSTSSSTARTGPAG